MSWIKVDHLTPDKPEVIGIAAELGLDQDAVLGKLVRLWIWADQQTQSGHASVTRGALPEQFIDRCVGVTGFAKAMILVGWLGHEEGKWIFPNFENHNGETAKCRALSAKRQKKYREHSNASVTRGALRNALPEEEEDEDEDRETPTESLRSTNDETPEGSRCSFSIDWTAAIATARRINKVVPAKSIPDRVLILRLAALSQSAIPEMWLIESEEATRKEKPRNPAAYLRRCIDNKAKDAGVNLKPLLAGVVVPAELAKPRHHRPDYSENKR